MKSFSDLIYLLCIKRKNGSRWTYHPCIPLNNTAQICLRKGNRIIHIKQEFPFNSNKRTIEFRHLNNNKIKDCFSIDNSVIGHCLELNKNWKQFDNLK